MDNSTDSRVPFRPEVTWFWSGVILDIEEGIMAYTGKGTPF